MSYYSRTTWSGALLMAIGLCLSACSNDDSNEENGTENHKGYRVSIPAQMELGTRAIDFGNGSGDIQASFATTEKVYVYNVTKSEMDAATLSPSSNGRSVTLDGTLTGDYYAEGDELKLFYHAGGDAASGSETTFDYTGQAGTQASAASKDFAVATVTVVSISAGELQTTGTAYFSNVQSIIRLSFDFTDWDNTAISTPSGITSLTISSANSSMATAYSPLNDTYTTTSTYTLTNPDLSTPIYLTIPFKESLSGSNDELTITATTSSGIQYQGTKTAPSNGFKNGHYYYSSTPVTLTKSTRTITVGIISGWGNKTDNYYVHYWGGSSGTGDMLLTADSPQKTESSTIDVFYDAQTWYLLTAAVPRDITGWKIVHDSNSNGTIDGSGDTWFGSDADASYSRAYLFSWDYNDGNGNVNRTEYR